MQQVGNVVQYILNMGASVMLPIMIFIIALIFRVKPAKALRSALTIGIGMVGINLVINLLTTNIGPAAKAMVKRFGFHLTIVDVGWPRMGTTNIINLDSNLISCEYYFNYAQSY